MATLRSLAIGLDLYETSDFKSCYVHDAIMDEFSSCLDKSGAVLFAKDDKAKQEAMEGFCTAID